MYRSHTDVPAIKSEKYIATLAKHFSKKVRVDTNEDRSTVYFPMGVCHMSLLNGAMAFSCEADDEGALEAVEGVISSHVTMLGELKSYQISWSRC
ncbi:DUF2218 domain-containing protein [Aestuariirhabdus sp. Z084]|uniref:DUF2218 domain-containing protein n=1 Tax=Aestuariirhabdus haliotis TaxID=2918751 RepID=UPI00201B4117|nr:DUF2218 domain-containing protein [Aestuariirhabdus haliotis]MCL6417610.1 DUF2218 domain-containing protein [Aestuariirhabdus haliotis]MCL6421536.1 DUF2218 domain-containing protein [Aestuariirhabdus haliotis]